MAQCNICNAQDEDITKKMLDEINSTESDDYFFMYQENIVCFDCYYIREKWENKDDIDEDEDEENPDIEPDYNAKTSQELDDKQREIYRTLK
jgi:hypothetical protein